MWQGRLMFGNRLESELLGYYRSHGSWQGVGPTVERISRDHGNAVVLWNQAGVMVAEADNTPGGWIGSMMPMMGMGPRHMGMRRDLIVNGKRVGAAFASPPTVQVPFQPPEQDFLSVVGRYLVLGALVSALLAIVIGMALSNHLTSPLAKLTEAARSLASGRLDHKVELKGSQEIEDLGIAFNKMADSIGENERLRRNMVADIAHELRTPIATIQVQLEGMIDDVIPTSAEGLRSIHEETMMLSRLADELRDLSLAEAGQLRLGLEPTDLDALAQRQVERMRAQFDKAGVALELVGVPVVVEVDQARMLQVLRNLLGNSLAHTGPGGKVTVDVHTEGHTAELTVADTGAGIEETDLPFIFERFYKGDKSRGGEGFGLGLTITKRLVEAHGGTINAESEPGRGTRITLRLPLAVSGDSSADA